jgi:quinol monooxygenase YgiN
MQDFLAAVPSTMSTGLDLSHYTETAGFLDKSGNCQECEAIYDTRVECYTLEDRNTALAKLAVIAEHIAEYEDGTCTFLVLKSLDSDTHLRIFGRYSSWDAMLAHQKGDKLVDLWLGSKTGIKSMEGRAYVPNGKGWLHH